MPRGNAFILFLVATTSLACYFQAPQSREARTLVEAMQLIQENYVKPVEKHRLFENAMKGLVGELDPYSQYIGAESYRRFQESLDQEFDGIGILVEGPPVVARLRVVRPLPDTPAHRAGVQDGDVILEIDGHDTEDMTAEDAVPLMRGKRGSEVHLLLERAGEEKPLEFSIRRDVIQTESVLGDTRGADGKWNFFLADHPQIGYIRVISFGERTAAELADALKFEPHPVSAVVLDLRDNPGGLLESAVTICDLFLDQGTIVRTQGRDGVLLRDFQATPGTILPASVPVVMLVNRFSASASEIVAGCLQDHERVTIVGQRTYGKGSVQNVIPLEGSQSALKLTTATYWRPSGHNIHRHARRYEEGDEEEWGVRPNDGLALTITEEDERKVVLARRQRDSKRADSAGHLQLEENTAPESVDAEGPDLPLKKAIELLDEKINQRAASPTPG